jgi:hypothetical protein
MLTQRFIAAAAAAAALAAPVAALAQPQSAAYRWAQPGCAPVTVPFAQPPAGVVRHAAVYRPSSAYVWAQPDCAPVSSERTQPPA